MTDERWTRLVSITLGRPFAIHEDDIDIAVRFYGSAASAEHY
jgi:hypothetical protein